MIGESRGRAWGIEGRAGKQFREEYNKNITFEQKPGQDKAGALRIIYGKNIAGQETANVKAQGPTRLASSRERDVAGTSELGGGGGQR